MRSQATERALEPIRLPTTSSIIADRLRSAIVAGTFGPGSQLTETALAEELGVSRGPLREAFQRLTQEGLVVNRRNRGVFVAILSQDDARDVYLARDAVESAAVVRLFEVDDARAAEALSAIVDEMEQAARDARWSEVANYDSRFHETLVRCSGSKRLVRMFSTLLSETQMCLHAAGPAYTSYMPIAQEHRALLNAIEGRDRDLSLHLLAEHMRNSSDLLVGRLPQTSTGSG